MQDKNEILVLGTLSERDIIINRCLALGGPEVLIPLGPSSKTKKCYIIKNMTNMKDQVKSSPCQFAPYQLTPYHLAGGGGGE